MKNFLLKLGTDILKTIDLVALMKIVFFEHLINRYLSVNFQLKHTLPLFHLLELPQKTTNLHLLFLVLEFFVFCYFDQSSSVLANCLKSHFNVVHLRFHLNESTQLIFFNQRLWEFLVGFQDLTNRVQIGRYPTLVIVEKSELFCDHFLNLADVVVERVCALGKLIRKPRQLWPSLTVRFFFGLPVGQLRNPMT